MFVIWKKHNFGLGWAFRHQYELILVLEKGNARYKLTDFSDVQSANHINHDKSSHPHQKPLDLIIKMIEHSSKQGDVVLDPFCGSGSVCVACQQAAGSGLVLSWMRVGLELRGGEFLNL